MPDPDLILASGSTIRKQMLIDAGISFDVITSEVDEDIIKSTFIEESFFNLLGFHLSGPAGLLFGLTLFCLFIILIRKERTSGKKKSETSDFEDIGQPIEAKINLSRSYIEMGQFGDASKYLQEALAQDNLSDNQKKEINQLLSRIKEDGS